MGGGGVYVWVRVLQFPNIFAYTVSSTALEKYEIVEIWRGAFVKKGDSCTSKKNEYNTKRWSNHFGICSCLVFQAAKMGILFMLLLLLLLLL